MKIKLIKGDLRYLPMDYVAHQCNCFTTMGAGIAKSLANTYTELRKVDKDYVQDFLNKDNDRKELLGHISKLTDLNCVLNRKITIVNCYSQFHYKRGQNISNLEAIESCFKQIGELSSENDKIGVPNLYGCGLATGDRDEIHKAIERGLSGYDVELYYVDFEEYKATID